MVLSLGFIMGLIGACIALIIGILIFSEVSEAIDCDVLSDRAMEQCNSAKDMAFTVVAILPIALFFAMFSIFGGFSSDEDEDEKEKEEWLTAKKVETKKERQRRKQKEVDDQLAQYDDKVVHSFLTNWFRGKKN